MVMDEDMGFCKGLIGGLAGFVLLLVGWLREVLKQLNEEKSGRLADLREHYRHVTEDQE